MDIYIITKGIYSDYHVCGVALTEENAKALQKIVNDGRDDADIIKFSTDDSSNIVIGYHVYSVDFDVDGNVKKVFMLQPDELCGWNPYGYEYVACHAHKTPGYCVRVVARDEHHAIKVASEKRTMYYAAKLERSVAENEENSDTFYP